MNAAKPIELVVACTDGTDATLNAMLEAVSRGPEARAGRVRTGTAKTVPALVRLLAKLPRRSISRLVLLGHGQAGHFNFRLSTDGPELRFAHNEPTIGRLRSIANRLRSDAQVTFAACMTGCDLGMPDAGTLGSGATLLCRTRAVLEVGSVSAPLCLISAADVMPTGGLAPHIEMRTVEQAACQAETIPPIYIAACIAPPPATPELIARWEAVLDLHALVDPRVHALIGRPLVSDRSAWLDFRGKPIGVTASSRTLDGLQAGLFPMNGQRYWVVGTRETGFELGVPVVGETERDG